MIDNLTEIVSRMTIKTSPNSDVLILGTEGLTASG